MDEVDVTQKRMEAEQEARAKVQKYMAGVRELKPTGFCHSPLCGEEVKGNRLFCDKQCSDDWERSKRK
ncbi:hypothetical protein [Immundisolibacter sp.]